MVSILPYYYYTLPGANFRQFHHLFLLAKIHHANSNDYIVDMATLTALVKFIPPKVSEVLDLAKFST